jgi:hypothetical protein
MKYFTFSLHQSRGKKIWISAYKNVDNKRDAEGDIIELNDISVMIELNIVDCEYKINWINERVQGVEKFIDTLGIEEDKQIIKDALQYARNKGSIDKVLNRYNKKL